MFCFDERAKLVVGQNSLLFVDGQDEAREFAPVQCAVLVRVLLPENLGCSHH